MRHQPVFPSWVSYVARRWFDARSKLAGSGASRLASFGIASGVATLVVVLGVMNGFQSGYMEAILEVSSFHARITLPAASVEDGHLIQRIRSLPGVRSVFRFSEARMLVAGPGGRVVPLKVLIIPKDFDLQDPGFAAKLGLDASIFGSATLGAAGALCLGSEAARQLAALPGDRLSVFVPVVSAEDGLSVKEEAFELSGTFSSGYYQFDSGLALVSEDRLRETGSILAGTELVYGVKLDDAFADSNFLALAAARLGLPPAARVQSWREYNRAFFGALKTEKTMMFILIGLVFLVVGVNIHHAMRRMVAMRNEDIAVLRSLGASRGEIQSIFAINGLVTGVRGTFFGLLIGLLIATNINGILAASDQFMQFFGSLASRLVPGFAPPLRAQSVFYLNEIPLRIYPLETMMIGLVAIGSALLAAISASRGISGQRPSEILRHE